MRGKDRVRLVVWVYRGTVGVGHSSFRLPDLYRPRRPAQMPVRPLPSKIFTSSSLIHTAWNNKIDR